MTDQNVGRDKEAALAAEMAGRGIREQDLVERFIRSQGPGGQNVNKTSTCVYLKHIPSGIEVKCQQERSQALNRYRARRILLEKLEARILGALSEKEKLIAKIRRQKRRRSRRAARKILEAKRKHSELKSNRRPIREI
jgi:protein subunit release factor B